MYIYMLAVEVESERPIYFRVAPLQMDLHFATVAIEINIREAAESHGWCQLYSAHRHDAYVPPNGTWASNNDIISFNYLGKEVKLKHFIDKILMRLQKKISLSFFVLLHDSLKVLLRIEWQC